ncbi:MAG: hypothetical protein ACREFO_17345 [Acetobacteraceae bacterium]
MCALRRTTLLPILTSASEEDSALQPLWLEVEPELEAVAEAVADAVAPLDCALLRDPAGGAPAAVIISTFGRPPLSGHAARAW